MIIDLLIVVDEKLQVTTDKRYVIYSRIYRRVTGSSGEAFISLLELIDTGGYNDGCRECIQ